MSSAQVFAGMYPMDQSEYPSLRSSLEKLILNDSSVSVFHDSSVALGQGWRLGFLGLLHMDVFRQRLEEVCVCVCVCVCACMRVCVCVVGCAVVGRCIFGVFTSASEQFVYLPFSLCTLHRSLMLLFWSLHPVFPIKASHGHGHEC